MHATARSFFEMSPVLVEADRVQIAPVCGVGRPTSPPSPPQKSNTYLKPIAKRRKDFFSCGRPFFFSEALTNDFTFGGLLLY